MPDLVDQNGEKELRITRPGITLRAYRPRLLGQVDVQLNEGFQDGHELGSIRRGGWSVGGDRMPGQRQHARRQVVDEGYFAGRHILRRTGDLEAAKGHPQIRTGHGVPGLGGIADLPQDGRKTVIRRVAGRSGSGDEEGDGLIRQRREVEFFVNGLVWRRRQIVDVVVVSRRWGRRGSQDSRQQRKGLQPSHDPAPPAAMAAISCVSGMPMGWLRTAWPVPGARMVSVVGICAAVILPEASGSRLNTPWVKPIG